MTEERPLVTIVIPARNEETDLEACLSAVASQDWPLERIEVLVVDGASEDATADVASRLLERLPLERGAVLSNPRGTTPSSLNVGLGAARGDIICRIDARSIVQPHHVRTCAETLLARPDVVVVGGSQHAVERPGVPTTRGIARALNNRYSMGLSRYRRMGASGPSDTVYLGAFRAADLRSVAGWDERLTTNQDFDLNRRLSLRGIVWYDVSLQTGYVPRKSLTDLARQYRRFGRWKARYWRMTGDRPRPRQLVLLAGPPVVATVAAMTARRRRAAAFLALSGVGLLFTVDAVGADEPAPLRTRAIAVQAMVVVGASWLWGVWSELLRPATHDEGQA